MTKDTSMWMKQESITLREMCKCFKYGQQYSLGGICMTCHKPNLDVIKETKEWIAKGGKGIPHE